jgi:DNA-binding NarL/FixJ family response regulator
MAITTPFGEGVRVVLADDHEIVRAGIRTLLEHISGIEVVGEASDGREAVALAAEMRPDLILMDLLMPKLSGIEATRLIAARFPDIRIIVLSGWGGDYAEAARKAGALGYVMKGSRIATLKAAIGAVLQGQPFPPPSEASGDGPDEAPDPLTGRQRDVFQLLVEGKATKEIAHILGVSPKTVETHRTEVMRRLGVRDVGALVRYALTKGLLPPRMEEAGSLTQSKGAGASDNA